MTSSFSILFFIFFRLAVTEAVVRLDEGDRNDPGLRDLPHADEEPRLKGLFVCYFIEIFWKIGGRICFVIH